MEPKKYPQGHFIGIGIAIGVPMGVVLGIALGDMAFLAIGIPIGLSVGVGLEEKYKKAGRIIPKDAPTLAKEKKSLKWVLGLGIVLLVAMLVLFIVKR